MTRKLIVVLLALAFALPFVVMGDTTRVPAQGISGITAGTTTIDCGANRILYQNSASAVVDCSANIIFAESTSTLTLTGGAVTAAFLADSGGGLGSIGTTSANAFDLKAGNVVIARLSSAADRFSIGTTTAPSGTAKALVVNNGTSTGNVFEFQDNGTPFFTGADGGLITSTGFIRQSAGELALNADFTSVDTTITSTALSATLVSGRTYSFTLAALFSNSTAADGFLLDFNGGTATVTNFRAHCSAANAAGAALAFTNAATVLLDTDIDVTLALTTQALMTCQGTIVPSANGTFIVRASEKVDGGGTLTIYRGSWLNIRDANPL